MSSISFANVWYLLIALPLVILFTVPFVLAVRKGNANGHNIASQVMHVFIAVIIAFAAAGTSFRTILTETNIYVLADVSYSAEKNLDTIDNYIKELELPANSKLGVVCFGKDCEILYNMGDPDGFTTVKDATVDTSETNIVKALEFTGELFKDDVIKRIVLITDGKATDTSDSYSNSITRVIDGLETKKIRVDAIYLNDNITSDVKEVQISSAEYTKNAYLNHKEQVKVSVRSSYNTRAVISLECNGEVKEKPLDLVEGVNQVDFDLDTSTEGEYDYKLTLIASEDKCSYNNTYSFTQTINAKMKVLALTGSSSEARALVQYYDKDVLIDLYVADKGLTGGITPETYPNVKLEDMGWTQGSSMTFDRIPNTMEEICEYDEFVISEVSTETIRGFSSFLKNLDIAVSKFGKTLLTFGSLHLQNSTDKDKQALGDILPVNFGNDEADPKLYTIIIDSSRSMNYLYHLQIAKQLAVKLVNSLNENDEVCVVTFYGSARMVVPPTPVNGNRQNIIDFINALKVVQGTVIESGLQMAYDFIVDLDYSEKQVMLISDGLNYLSSPIGASDIALEMKKAGIYLSVFDVGRQGDQADGSNTNSDNSRAKQLLYNLSISGGGKYYYSNNQQKLNDVTFADIQDIVTQTVNDKEAEVKILRRVDESLKGITAVPSVMGYVYSKIKPSATTVLALNHVSESEERQIPLYAYWRYGKGIVASFTSRLGNDWLSKWKTNGIDATFFSNVGKEIFPDEKVTTPYILDVEKNGSFFEVTATPGKVSDNEKAEVTAEITMPDGDKFFKLMKFNGEAYYCNFDNTGIGKYRIDIVYKYGSWEYSSSEAYNYSYSVEYDSFAIFDPSALYKALNGRGDVSLDGKLSLENPEGSVTMYDVDLTMPLMIAAIVIYIVDITVRKLKWEDVVSFFGLFRKTNNNKTGGKQR